MMAETPKMTEETTFQALPKRADKAVRTVSAAIPKTIPAPWVALFQISSFKV